MATDEQNDARDDPSGITTQDILDDLLARRVGEVEKMAAALGGHSSAKNRKVFEALADGFRSGFRQCIADLVGMNVIQIITLPIAPAGDPADADK